jgi:hypothetical protein
MTTFNLVTSNSGTGFTLNVTVCNLLPDILIQDFIVLHASVPVPANQYNKLSQTSIQYVGSSIGTTAIEVRRRTPVSQIIIENPAFLQRLSSARYNQQLDRIQRYLEEVDLNGSGPGAIVSSPAPINTPFGVSWSSDTFFSATRKAIYDQVITLAPTASPTFTGTPTFTGIPTAPTPSPGDNTFKVATTAFVQAALSSYNATLLNTANTWSLAQIFTTAPIFNGGGSFNNAAPVFNAGATFPSGATFNAGATFNTTSPTAPTPVFTDVTLKVANTTFVSTSNRPYLFASRTSNQSLAHASFVTILWNTVTTDTSAAYNSSTGEFTVPVNLGGVYYINASVGLAVSVQIVLLYVYVNGTLARVVSDVRSTVDQLLNVSGGCLLPLSVGDIVTIRIYQSNTSFSSVNTSGAVTSSYFNLFRIRV